MDDTKKCIGCYRFYRGEGHNEHCTSHCYAINEYKRRHGGTPRSPRPLHEKRLKKNDPIKESNDRWLNKKPMDKETLKKMRIGRAKYEVKSLYNDDLFHTRLKVMRG
jgi:hypothetical protein